MPTRYIKPGICDSKHMDEVSAEAERLWTRLLVNVDDFGRLDARLTIIKSKCFPLKDGLKFPLIEEWLKELVKHKLAVVYTCMEDPYIQLLKWDNKPRASESRFPEYNDECIQMYTNVPLTETVNRKQKPKQKPITVATSNEVTDVFNFWQSTLNHPRARLDDKRKDSINKALKLGYEKQDLQDAIIGCSMSEYHMGKNERQGVYDSIDLIFRDADQIDKFIGIKNKGGAKVGKGALIDAVNQSVIDDFVNEGKEDVIDVEVVK